MAKKRIVLTFPASLSELPLTNRLVKDFDLSINILKAKILPGEEGKLVLELEGTIDQINAGLDFLIQQGLFVEPVSKEIALSEDGCVQCGACTTVCASEALTMTPKGELKFDRERCIVCELCVPACPVKVIKVMF